MGTVIIYANGACSGNPGQGGWAARILDEDHKDKDPMCGTVPNTTNNRMELMGVIKALEQLKEVSEVELYSDSKYVIDGLRKGWAEDWKKNEWVKNDGKYAKNADLWEQLLKLCEKRAVHPNWIHQEGGNTYHAECNAVAKECSKRRGETWERVF
ncbi:MAG: ribonuclease HI [Acetatifactor sp.]|nr:ribonuclease HI [Acetatifactor sp.]